MEKPTFYDFPTPSGSRISTALIFLNSLHHKNSEMLTKCFDPSGAFQDVLPNGTIVKSSSELLMLHVGFMQNKRTGFRPFNWKQEFNDENNSQSKDRDFSVKDLDSFIEFDSGYFCRVAAEVDLDRSGDLEQNSGKIRAIPNLLV